MEHSIRSSSSRQSIAAQSQHLRIVRDEDAAPYDGQTKAERSGDGRFALIPDAVLTLGDGYAIAVYAALAKHADATGICRPSVATLCTLTGWSHPTIHKALDTLIAAGVLARHHRDFQGMKRSNEYLLPLHRSRAKTPEPQIATSLPTIESTLRADSNDVANRSQPRFQEVEPREQDSREPEGIAPLPPKRSQARACDLAGFDEWWEIFPRKENKAKARDIWKRLLPDADLIATILERTRAYAICDKVQRGYAMLPTTFLNGRRWEDDLSSVGTAMLAPTRPGKRLTSEQIMARAGLFERQERRS